MCHAALGICLYSCVCVRSVFYFNCCTNESEGNGLVGSHFEFNCCPSTAWTIWSGLKNVCVLKHCFRIFNESEYVNVKSEDQCDSLVCLRVFV